MSWTFIKAFIICNILCSGWLVVAYNNVYIHIVYVYKLVLFIDSEWERKTRKIMFYIFFAEDRKNVCTFVIVVKWVFSLFFSLFPVNSIQNYWLCMLSTLSKFIFAVLLNCTIVTLLFVAFMLYVFRVFIIFFIDLFHFFISLLLTCMTNINANKSKPIYVELETNFYHTFIISISFFFLFSNFTNF